MNKRIILIIIIGLFLFVLPLIAEAEIVDSGTCGTGVTWALDNEGLLTISGSGYMTSHPWEHSPKKVNIQGGVKNICDDAFDCCYDLTAVSIPNSITQIGKNAFWGCTGLKAISLPNSITSIDEEAFSNCINLEIINLPSNIKTIELGLFSNCASLKSITIPNSVTCISWSAFADCGSLTKVVIPDSVTELRSYAFSGCSSLSEIKLSKNMIEIDVGTFSDCGKLSKITIPEGIKSIEIEAFYNCYELINISFPASLSYIGEDALKNCYKLQQITIPESNTFAIQWCKDNGYEGILKITKTPTTTTVKGLKYKLNNKALTATVAGANKNTITSLTIPATVKAYGNSYKVTAIANNAFKKYAKLKKITIGKNITKIGKNAFNGCKKLKTITIKATKLKTVGSGAFKGIESKATIKCPKKQKAAYEKLLRKKGVPKTVKFK